MPTTKKKIKRKILHYTVVFSRESDGGYSVKVPKLSGCFSQGDTFREAFKNIKEAVELYDAKEASRIAREEQKSGKLREIKDLGELMKSHRRARGL
ncbi:MAG: type II toxin-antitoxin system HicB family antitoxin [bacterium]|nr:type II toxin-antitoxin system HicB family antitoxin [bacterium]MDZ4285907.1 type II toxin-antitoxin system HicB family antitoxin [Candidatus Sungbacteria bacterium]